MHFINIIVVTLARYGSKGKILLISPKTLLRYNFVVSDSIFVFHPGCEIWRMVLAYLGYITPSVLLLILLTFYDPKTTLCYEFKSTFLLDNTHPPSLPSFLVTGNITQKFQTFYTNFGDGNEQEDIAHLANLSIPNKYFLLETVGPRLTFGIIKYGSKPFGSTRKYIHQILGTFKSGDFIENLLSVLREFGFLHFCSARFTEPEFWQKSEGNILPVADTMNKGKWWPGYSPYDVDYSDDFEILFDALLHFQEDIRFSEHIACLAKIFDIDPNVLYRDFSEMKDLKVPKTSLVVRRGKYLNGSFTVTFKSHEDIFIKVFTEVMDSLTPEINESVVCRSQSLKSNSFRKSQGEMVAEVKRMYKDTFDLEIKKDLKYLAENTIPRLRQGLFLQNV